MNYQAITILLLCVNFVHGLTEDEVCEIDGVPAKCVLITNCTTALNDIKNRQRPQICSFRDIIPVVCCKDYMKPVESRNNKEIETKCAPLSKKITKEKTGQKALDKCIEYQEQVLYPCVKNEVNDEWHRVDNCYHEVDDLILGGGGIDAELRQFPHMALLGYGSMPSMEWLCGGSVISDRFIVTAGHCTSSIHLGPITYALLGTLKRSEVNKDFLYSIKNIIKHPEYKPPSKYHDIALLEVNNPIRLDKNIMPICLHTGDKLPDHIVSATGWGALGYRRENAEILQDVPLWKVSDENCSAHYPPYRLLNRGYDKTTQMCYGDDGTIRDTCSGDSGGPIQIRNKEIHCTYTMIGVTSFGRNCGTIGFPGIYTRVSYYVSWIESIVWP